MSMLKEFLETRQYEGEPRRRWFYSKDLDLIVWVNEANLPFKFQLCYDSRLQEHALTWESGRGFDHSCVDSTKSQSGHMASQILVHNGDQFDRDRVRDTFVESSHALEVQIRDLITLVLDAYPNSPNIAARRPAPLLKADKLPASERRPAPLWKSEGRPWWKFWA